MLTGIHVSQSTPTFARLFKKLYPTTEAARGKEFPHSKEVISKTHVASKLKAILWRYGQVMDSGQRSGHGRVVLIYLELCEQIWGGLPATNAIKAELETANIQGR